MLVTLMVILFLNQIKMQRCYKWSTAFSKKNFSAGFLIIKWTEIQINVIWLWLPIIHQNLRSGVLWLKISTCEKLLRVKTDYKLTFDNHVANLCKKANNKLKALATATSQMSIEKRKLLINFYFNAQLDYCPLCRST